MLITNKAELEAKVAKWLVRSDLGDIIPDFIATAERRIFRELRTPANERTVYKDRRGSDGDEWLIPEHFLELKKLIVNGQALERITDTEYYALPEQSGQPRYFFRYANKFKVWPAPDADYRWVLNFWTDFELTDAEPTNTVLQMAPDLYLYGALIEGEDYLMNTERVKLWAAKFDAALAQLNTMAKRAELSGSASRQRAAR